MFDTMCYLTSVAIDDLIFICFIESPCKSIWVCFFFCFFYITEIFGNFPFSSIETEQIRIFYQVYSFCLPSQEINPFYLGFIIDFISRRILLVLAYLNLYSQSLHYVAFIFLKLMIPPFNHNIKWMIMCKNDM